MGIRKLCTGVALAALCAASAVPAQALTIVLNNTGGVEAGTAAWRSFQTAANFWEGMFTNNATVKVDVGYRSFGAAGATVLGQAGSTRSVTSIRNWENRLFTQGNSAVDALVRVNMPATDANGAIKMITPGYVDPVNQLGVDTTTRVWDADGSFNNRAMALTTAHAKAMGYAIADSVVDSRISFNSDFNFDFDPTDGTTPGSYDFLYVAIHELGHALGFVSGVDDYDLVGEPNGPYADEYKNYDVNADWWGMAIDMFRYSSNPDGLGGAGPKLDWSIREPGTENFTNPYFSLDSGQSIYKNAYFSRGDFNGSSYQASHWRSAAAQNPASGYVGVMNPYGLDASGTVTATDLVIYDAIGWNTRIDALNSDWSMNMAQIYEVYGVPEPATWLQMIFGFGMLAGVLRRRREKTGHAVTA